MIKLKYYRKLYKLLIILTIFWFPVNFALAEDLVIDNQAVLNEEMTIKGLNDLTETIDGAPVIVLNTERFEITKEEAWSGKKFKVFNNNFVFQLDSKLINTPATLILKEMILSPASQMAPTNGLQLGSKVYEFDFKTTQKTNLDKAIWFSIKYDSNDYFRKNLYYFDQIKNQWIGLPSIIKDGSKKIIANFSLPYARLAILEDIDIMTEGLASWYKYKNCDCAASPDYPKGTKLKVTNLKNGKSVIVKVNDWGPNRSIHPDRIIDLDIVAFKKIAKKSEGLCKVKVEPFNKEVITSTK